MSSPSEKIESIKCAIRQAEKIVNKYETILSCGSKLHKTQQYELDMARNCVQKGKLLLKENGIDL